MIITISGIPGAGKTSVGRMLAKSLKCSFVSVGENIRAIAEKKKESIASLSHSKKVFAKVQKHVESLLDSLKDKKNIVIDGRDAFFHIPRSLKVFLYVDSAIAARRIIHHKRLEEHFNSLEDAVASLKERSDNDKKRYIHMHGIDYTDKKYYDLVINTSRMSVEEIVRKIVKKVVK